MHHDGGQYLPVRLALLPAARYYLTHLTRRPDDFAQSPGNRVGSRMDVLLTVLKTVKLEGAMFYNAEFSAPWSFRAPPSGLVAPYLSPEPRHVIMYHLLTHGLKLARMGGGGEITRFICGYLVCDPQLCKAFLGGLPPIFKVNIGNDSSGQWLENCIRYSVGQAVDLQSGSEIVVAKLSEALFAETLRRYVDLLPPGQTGWLAGARDPDVGNALALVHREPADPWTIAELARRVGVSRSVLAERFRHFLGVPPMAYLARWRMQLGAQLLTSTSHSVAQIADEVGYESEPAFNRAFKREFGSPPARFRMKSKAAAAH